jgi:hypothetical protein
VPRIGALQRPPHHSVWTIDNVQNLGDEQPAIDQNAITTANNNLPRGHSPDRVRVLGGWLGNASTIDQV